MNCVVSILWFLSVYFAVLKMIHSFLHLSSVGFRLWCSRKHTYVKQTWVWHGICIPFTNVRPLNSPMRWQTITIGACVQAVAYAIQASAPPYPLFTMSYILSGFGLALQVRDSLLFVDF